MILSDIYKLYTIKPKLMKKISVLIILFSTINIYSQNNFQKNIDGKWKLEKVYDKSTFLNFGEYLKILGNEIHFYNLVNWKETNLTIIKFYYIDYTDGYYHNKDSQQLIKLENGEVWELRLRIINNETRLIFDLKITEEGYYLVSADDRGIIRDPKERKEALEGEINTYYIKYN